MVLSLEICSDTNTKRQFTVFDYVNLLNPDTITFDNCLISMHEASLSVFSYSYLVLEQ